MNKDMKTNLETVITSLINDDATAAKSALHDYLRAKAQSIVLGEKEEDEVDVDVEDKEVDDEDKEEDKEDKDEDKEDADDEEGDDDEDEDKDEDE